MPSRSTAVAAAAVLALAACGKKREAGQRAPEPPAAPTAPVPLTPAPPPTPRVLPTFVTIDEIRAHLPATPALRMTGETALDPSGKQAIGTGCVTAANPKVAMHQLADAYGVGRWQVKIRTTSQGDTRGEFTADFPVSDGTLHVRGVLTSSASCNPGEIGLTIYYSKVVEAATKPPPPRSGATITMPPPPPTTTGPPPTTTAPPPTTTAPPPTTTAPPPTTTAPPPPTTTAPPPTTTAPPPPPPTTTP